MFAIFAFMNLIASIAQGYGLPTKFQSSSVKTPGVNAIGVFIIPLFNLLAVTLAVKTTDSAAGYELSHVGPMII